MGDSAGAGMSLSLVQKKIAEDKLVQPSKTILISPWLDVTMSNKEIDEVQKKRLKIKQKHFKNSGNSLCKNRRKYNKLSSKPNLWKARKSKKYSCIYRNKRYFKSDVHILEQKLEDIKINEYEGAIHNWILEKIC